MSKMKVYELAKELDIPSKELIEFLGGKQIEVKSHMSSLEEPEVKMVRDSFRRRQQAWQRNRRKSLRRNRRRSRQARPRRRRISCMSSAPRTLRTADAREDVRQAAATGECPRAGRCR